MGKGNQSTPKGQQSNAKNNKKGGKTDVFGMAHKVGQWVPQKHKEKFHTAVNFVKSAYKGFHKYKGLFK
jgi:hypothetical protein